MAKKISELVNGDTLFCLEQDRRSKCPIFDTAKVIKADKPKPLSRDNNFVACVELQIVDSLSSLSIVLPAEDTEGICSNVYYTTDPNKIMDEVILQRDNAQSIINNIDKYQYTVEECNKIIGVLSDLTGTSVSQTQSLDKFKEEISQKVEIQSQMLAEIYNSLGLNKNK